MNQMGNVEYVSCTRKYTDACPKTMSGILAGVKYDANCLSFGCVDNRHFNPPVECIPIPNATGEPIIIPIPLSDGKYTIVPLRTVNNANNK